MSEIAAALERLDRQGNAELDKAFSEYYPDLKRVARARLRGSGMQGHLQTTALVHESYVKLSAGAGASFADRVHFLAYASRTLRSIIVDAIREERALRRGGDLDIVTLDTAAQEGVEGPVDVESVSGALDDLAKLDPGLARLVEMRFFGGMTEPEIADALGLSVRTVSREWQKARALLLTLLGD
ncbi:MAG: sigma-70 family RNA polymerase sigma factor [Burkholderiales bacterium]|nr:sigma-70 family RNA polymerase sigma factor [Burkholderiales bacterium]